jgi:hypothetical protein
MSLLDAQRQKLKVKTWDTAAGRGVLIDRTGFGYPVTLAQLGPEFQIAPPNEGEILERVVCGPGEVRDITDPKTERIQFESVGPHPEGSTIAQEIGRRLEGGRPQTFGNPHDGRFSHPK